MIDDALGNTKAYANSDVLKEQRRFFEGEVALRFRKTL